MTLVTSNTYKVILAKKKKNDLKKNVSKHKTSYNFTNILFINTSLKKSFINIINLTEKLTLNYICTQLHAQDYQHELYDQLQF